jgi:heme oxygenase
MKKLNIRLLKRNHELYKKFKIQERLNLCLIREEDNAFRRNMKAVEYIDKNMKKSMCSHLGEIRKILTMYKEENVLAEVNKGGNNE